MRFGACLLFVEVMPTISSWTLQLSRILLDFGSDGVHFLAQSARQFFWHFHRTSSDHAALFNAGGDPERPLVPLPERLNAEAALADAILNLADVACKSAEDMRQLIAGHGSQARSLRPFSIWPEAAVTDEPFFRVALIT